MTRTANDRATSANLNLIHTYRLVNDAPSIKTSDPYHSTMLSWPFARMLVLVHSPPGDPTVVARSSLLGSAWRYDRGDWQWSFGTEPEWTLLASRFPGPGRSVVSLEDRLSRFVGRGFCPLLALLEMEEGAVRRLNDRQ